MTYRISAKLNLPEDAALWSIAELAIRGAGKTYAASVLAEEFVKAGVPIVCIDGMGVWWGLRVGTEGREGLPVVVFGGDHKDISIPTKSDKGRPIVDEERLKLMVKAILEARMSAVLDTSEFSKGMQRRIVAIFVNELYHLNKNYGVRHVFIEEADLWCPQRIVADVAQSAGAIDDLVRRGGNFNLGCTLITQRSAVLNKDVLSQCSCLIVLRILHKLDKQAVQGWVESVAHPDDPRIKKWYDSLKDLKNGEAWLWHPESDLFERFQFRKRETLHATREYFRQAEFEQKDIRMMDVGEFVSKFKSVFEPKPREQPAPIKAAPILQRVVAHETRPEYAVPYPEAKRDDSASLETPIREGPQEIDLEHKQLVVKINHSEKAVSMDTDSQRGQVIYLLGLGEDKTLSITQIIEEAAEHGWVIPYDTARKSLIPGMQRDGLLVREGAETHAGKYRLPRFVRFDVRKVEA
jgi:hypothetical protein